MFTSLRRAASLYPFLPIWQRHFFRSAVKLVFLLLAAFAFIYVVIDYSSHLKLFHGSHSHLGLRGFVLYYAAQIAIVIPMLLPFCVVVASARVLAASHSRFETVALLSAGVSKRRLLRPFLFLGLFAALFIYLDEQFFIPKASYYVEKIEESYMKVKWKNKYVEGLQNMALEDGSNLLFKRYDVENERLKDVLWVRSIDELWRLDLFPLSGGLLTNDGQTNRHFTRNENHALIRTDTLDSVAIPKIKLEELAVWTALVDPNNLSLMELGRRYLQVDESDDKGAFIKTVFLYKMGIPWIGLLAFFAIAPGCFYFGRGSSVFLLYIAAIFGLVAFFIVLDSFVLLARQQMIAPLYALALPFLFLLSLALWRRQKINS